MTYGVRGGFCVVSIAALPLLGCSPEPAPVEVVAHAVEPIAGGKDDYNDTNVVGVVLPQEGYLCSGSLIAPNVVLTAHHCVANIVNGSQGVLCASTGFTGPFPASHFVVTPKYDSNDSSADHTVREVRLPTTDTLLCGKDLAILILDKPFTTNEALAPFVPRVDTELAKGEIYSAIGYGGTDQAADGAGYRRRRDGLAVQCGGTQCQIQLAEKTEWIGQTGICEGDSGGPAVDAQGRVVGVTSRGQQGCNSPIYGSVAGWGQWIKDTVVYAAGLGGYTAPPWSMGFPTDPAFTAAVGDACTQPSDCKATGLCWDSYCTRPCNDQAACPDGYDCVPNGGMSLCQLSTPAGQGAGGGGDTSGGGATKKGGCSATPSGDGNAAWAAIAVALAAVAARRRARR